MNNNPYIPQKVKVLNVTAQTNLDITYKLACDMKPENGQFVQVSIPGGGEAPISISDFGDGYIEMTIRKVGTLTNEIYSLKPGDDLFIRGPYGKGFPIEKYKQRQLIVIAGGTGLAPVKSIINHFYRNPGEVNKLNILLGFKSPEDILFREEIALWKEKFDITLTVDQAQADWQGNTGLIRF
ncbi:NAD(P)H-flavin reductase [Desulfitispora alkaliphila]|uniref:hypothetical protein n=1 Tax=Desulfitispora alkaliphila TaxID=622674 RepID=UPI003D22AE32